MKKLEKATDFLIRIDKNIFFWGEEKFIETWQKKGGAFRIIKTNYLNHPLYWLIMTKKVLNEAFEKNYSHNAYFQGKVLDNKDQFVVINNFSFFKIAENEAYKILYWALIAKNKDKENKNRKGKGNKKMIRIKSIFNACGRLTMYKNNETGKYHLVKEAKKEGPRTEFFSIVPGDMHASGYRKMVVNFNNDTEGVKNDKIKSISSGYTRRYLNRIMQQWEEEESDLIMFWADSKKRIEKFKDFMNWSEVNLDDFPDGLSIQFEIYKDGAAYYVIDHCSTLLVETCSWPMQEMSWKQFKLAFWKAL